MRKISLVVSFLFACCCLFAQTHTRVCNEQIRSLRVARDVLVLGEEESLHISFDEMSHDVHFYTYTVTMLHSDLLSNEYLEGFTTRDITDYDHSLTTSRIYTHYWFNFPNEELRL